MTAIAGYGGTLLAPPVETEAEALLREADAARAAGNRSRAIELYERVMHELPRHGAQAATVLRRLGLVCWEDGQIDYAIDVLQVALVAADRGGDMECAAHVQNILAVCHWQRGQLDEAERLYHAARRTANEARNASLVAMIDQNLGIIESVRGNLQTALRHYRHALNGYRLLGKRAHLGRLLSNMGMLYTALARWDDAERAYAEAADCSIEVGDQGARDMVEVNRVQLWISRGDIDRARDACNAVLARSAEIDSRTLGETLKLRGVVARESRENAQADDYLRQALDLARERQDPLLEAETLREMAEVACAMDRNRDMLRCLSQAHHIFAGLRARRDLDDVGARAQRLERRFQDVVMRWSASIESKDPYTQGHCERVSLYACALAERSGFDTVTMFWFRVGALLHDVGKIVVPIGVLTKPGPLTPEERSIMEKHALAGAELLSDVEFPWDVLPIIRNHHERWDGRGYPDRLAGEAIPLAARILGVADVYDALTTDRPYRKAFTMDKALEIMRNDVGAFDPALFALFCEVLPTLAPARHASGPPSAVAVA